MEKNRLLNGGDMDAQQFASGECNPFLLVFGAIAGAALSDLGKHLHDELVSPGIKSCLARCGVNYAKVSERPRWQQVGLRVLEIVIVLLIFYVFARVLLRKKRGGGGSGSKQQQEYHHQRQEQQQQQSSNNTPPIPPAA